MENGKSQQTSDAQPSSQSSNAIFAALVASMGGVLFGYDIGIISGALLQLHDEFDLSCFQQEMIVCSVLIGAFIASFFGGNIVDQWGRKTGIAVSCGLFIVGNLILCFSISFTMLVFGRIVVGAAVSLSVTSECTYIAEISPPNRRGMMVSLNEVGITLGFLLAYLVDYLFISTSSGWKFMFALATIPAVLQGFGVAFLPNSHHYLLVKGRTEEARRALCNLRNTKNIDEEMNSIISSIKEQKSSRYVDLFSSSYNMRSRMFLGMSLVFLQQFSGNANVLYYAPTVFQHFGYGSDSSATLVTLGLGVVKVLSTVVTLLIVDKVGRRSLLLLGCIFMATSLIILGIVGTVRNSHSSQSCSSISSHKKINPIFNRTEENLKNNFTTVEFKELFDKADLSSGSSLLVNGNRTFDNEGNLEKEFISFSREQNKEVIRNLTMINETNLNSTELKKNENATDSSNSSEHSSLTKIISVVALMTFVCSYGMSYGPVTWLVLGEIFPGSLRGRAVSVATCINWASNILVSFTFLDVLNAIGVGPTFVMFGCISYVAAIFVFFCVPETKNKTLEEISKNLNDGLIRKDIKYCLHLKSNHQESVVKPNQIGEQSSVEKFEIKCTHL